MVMQDLNRNELETLRILWQGGPLKPAEIQKQFSWSIENPTLRSVLRVLVDEGLVAREKAGKAFLYQAKASQRGLLTGMMRRLSQVFAGGSPAALVAQLMEIEKLSPQDVAELRETAKGPADRSGRNGGRKQ
jgi:predicted transcriptional regulator